MDWELKASAWDSSEMGREDDTRLAALVVSGSSLGVHKNGGGFSVDFKLGGLGDLGDGSVMRKLKEPGRGGGGSTMGSSASGSSKRTRAINGPQNVSCLVDGCAADLSNCREYHRRHRVCERHSKTPVVFVGGKEQRFCQQCSRFQSLGEFDEEKRSCRKRLDGHNRRRRKPRPEAFYMNTGTFSSNYQGLLQFSGLQAYATSTAGVVPTWPRVAEHCQDLHDTDQRSTIPSSLACIYNGDKRFPFLLASNPERSNQAVPEVSICQQLVNNRASSPGRDTFHQKISSDGLTQSVDSKHAHSLLSSHPTQTLETSLSHLFQRDLIHPNQPVGTGLRFDGLAQYSRSQGVEEKPPLLVPWASNANNLCNRCFECRLMICGIKGPHKCFHSAGSS